MLFKQLFRPVSFTSILDAVMFSYLIGLLLLTDAVTASRGDRSEPYQLCIGQCRRQFGCHPDFGDVSWSYLNCSRCRYNCVWSTVELFEREGVPVPQFHGKWPFIALNAAAPDIFVQEPASVIFSLANLVGMLVMLIRIHRTESFEGRKLWSCYSIVGAITWICSTAFHWIDIRLTEYLDYFSAFAFVIFGFYASVHIIFPELTKSPNGRLFSWFLALLCFGFYTQHVLNMMNDFDYGYNMKCCIACSVCTTLLYLYYLLERYRRAGGLSHSDKSLVIMIFIANGSVLFELLEFMPLFSTIDSHSLFHFGTIPLPFLFSEFLVSLSKEEQIFIAAKNV